MTAVDVGANNLVACTTSTGQQYCYDGRRVFADFRELTDRIASYQSKLDDQRRNSQRIDRLYRKRSNRRSPAQNALIRDLAERLHEEGVSDLYVGELTDVLETHWSAVVNEKTHNFWAFDWFTTRLKHVCEEYGITVHEESERDTTRTCPECGEKQETVRRGDWFGCPCGYDGHADLDASQQFLEQQTETELEAGLTGITRLLSGGLPRFPRQQQPVRFQWDDHTWSGTSYPRDSPNEVRTDQSTHHVGNLAAVVS